MPEVSIFKFGGASVKDADAVRNVVRVLDLHESQKICVVVSAMGKTTNAMEEIVTAYWNQDINQYLDLVEERRVFHYNILQDLFENEKHKVYDEVKHIFDQLHQKANRPVSDHFNFEYDQIVSLGEILSTKIIAAYIKKSGKKIQWVDARQVIRTDHNYREGKIDWDKTRTLVQQHIHDQFFVNDKDIVMTQGFIGHTSEGFSTTLGREGSDFSAGVLAYSLDAKDVTIWKDVPGMLNADPKYFDNTVKLNQISFKEAIELAYFGASVIHPKTIKPLQNKNIPLYVKSFVEPQNEGTKIHQDAAYDADVSSFIFKLDQILVSITPKDFSFVVEENLGAIFNFFAAENIKVNLMQNSAISFSVVLDNTPGLTDKILSHFKEEYNVKFNEGLELVTIRHFDQKTIDRVSKEKNTLLEQKTRQTARLVLSNR